MRPRIIYSFLLRFREEVRNIFGANILTRKIKKRRGKKKKLWKNFVHCPLLFIYSSFLFVYLSILLPIVRLRGSVVFGCKLTPLDGSANTHRPII
jgi:hypothetical protein